MNIGVTGGQNDRTVASVPDGDSRTGRRKNMGSIMRIITGIIRLWASLISLHEAPIAQNNEPYIRIASAE